MYRLWQLAAAEGFALLFQLSDDKWKPQAHSLLIIPPVFVTVNHHLDTGKECRFCRPTFVILAVSMRTLGCLTFRFESYS